MLRRQIWSNCVVVNESRVRRTRTYPAIKFAETIKACQGPWFYCKDIPDFGAPSVFPLSPQIVSQLLVQVAKGKKIEGYTFPNPRRRKTQSSILLTRESSLLVQVYLVLDMATSRSSIEAFTLLKRCILGESMLALFVSSPEKIKLKYPPTTMGNGAQEGAAALDWISINKSAERV